MSLRVDPDRLRRVAEDLGTTPMLLTCDPDGRPRAAAVTVQWDDDRLTVRAGRRSSANAAARPLVSLLWPAPPGGRFALLVDGVADPPEGGDDGSRAEGAADAGSGAMTLRVSSGILHVVAPAG